MKLRSKLLLSAGFISLVFFLAVVGCGGASLDMGKYRNLEQVEPDMTDPVWYDDYANDRADTYKRYKGKVVELTMTVEEIEEDAGGIHVLGTTGDQDRYRITCVFPAAASTALQNVKATHHITVKGLFDHIQETARTYQIYLKNCALVSG